MKRQWRVVIGFLLMNRYAFAMMDNAQMSVWVNEAIVETYTYNFEDIISRQKEFAKYFTAEGWINYTKALNATNLLDAVKKNKYTVSAVATLPPSIKKIGPQEWEAVMTLLAMYKNPQHQQTQTLEVVMDFIEAPEGQGVRGLAITSFQAKKSKPPCVCSKDINPL